MSSLQILKRLISNDKYNVLFIESLSSYGNLLITENTHNFEKDVTKLIMFFKKPRTKTF